MTLRRPEPNPILARELRSYWRRRWSFGLVFGYTALLAVIMGLQYDTISQSTIDPATAPPAGSQEQMAQAGHDLFSTAAWMELLGLIVIAPAMTAPAIAAEREGGLLEILQISPLKPLQIVTGKLGSILAVLGLILLVTLPINGICFLLGGVSPAELCLVAVLHVCTTVVSASIGITVSARSRRGNNALRATFGYLVAWGISSLIAFLYTSRAFSMRGMSPFTCNILAMWAHGNPLIACAEILAPRSIRYAASPRIPALAAWILNHNVAYCLAFEIVATCLLLWVAARAVRKPLADEAWVEFKVGGEGKLHREASHQTPKSRFDAPFAGTIGAGNPIFQRELRGKFRMRMPSKVVLFVEAVLALGVFGFYCYLTFLVWTDSTSREVVWWGVTGTVLFVIMFATAIMGACGFTRERETGTWESLRLSLLQPSEIVAGKLSAIGLTCAILIVPLLPLLLPCIRSLHRQSNDSSGISLIEAAGTLLVIGMTALCYTSWGLLVSWFSRRTTGSVGWTIGSIILASILFGILGSVLVQALFGNNMGPATEKLVLDLATLLEPFVALSTVQDSATRGGFLGFVLVYTSGCSLFLLTVRLLLLRFMVARPNGYTAEG